MRSLEFDAGERKIAGDRYTYGSGQTKEHYEHLLAYHKKERTEPPRATPLPSARPNERRRCARRTRTFTGG